MPLRTNQTVQIVFIFLSLGCLSSMSVPTLVKAKWLRQLMLQSPKYLRVLDASLQLTKENRDARQEFIAHRIPGAKFFDVNECADNSSPYEHTLPNIEDFSNYVRSLGVRNDSHVVVYDNNDKVGLYSAPRVWWMLRAFGHHRVSILDGGFPRWCAEGHPIESGSERKSTVQGDGPFKATLNTGMFCNFDFVKANLAQGTFQVADARPPDKFHGIESDPHPNFPSGHIPRAINFPYAQCLDPETKLMKTPDELKKVFEDAGIDLGKPLIVSCGSGMTACVVALASYLCGKKDTIVYDGSWMEWRQRASPDMIERDEPAPFQARF